MKRRQLATAAKLARLQIAYSGLPDSARRDLEQAALDLRDRLPPRRVWVYIPFNGDPPYEIVD